MPRTRNHLGAGGSTASLARALVAILAGVLVAGCAAGCGDNDGVQQDAAPQDVPVTEDTLPSQVDASSMACVREYERCETAGPEFCQEYGLECVPVRVDVQASVCLRRCTDTAQCPFNSYCVPTEIEFGGLKLAAHHCFGSVCGKVYGNGELFGACSVGGDNLVRLDAGQQRPGTCIPIDTDAGTGVCAESGSEADGGVPASGRDQTCTLDMVALACPPRGHPDLVGCVTGTTCLGPLCEGFGSCALMCDPRLDPEAQCAVAPGKPKQYCQDISLYTLGASGKLHLGFVGVCQENPLCRLFTERLDGGAPADTCLASDECYPTTMASTNGVCFKHAEKAVGQACEFLNDCALGAICVGSDPCGAGTCQQLCPLPDDGRCGTGKACVGVALDSSQPTVKSVPWGVCAEASEQGLRRTRALIRPTVARRR